MEKKNIHQKFGGGGHGPRGLPWLRHCVHGQRWNLRKFASFSCQLQVNAARVSHFLDAETGKNRLPTQTAEHDRVFSHGYEGNSAAKWQLLIGTIRNSQRRQTRLRSCSNALWDFLWPVAKHAFDTTTEGIYLRTRSDRRLFNLVRLRAKTNVRKVLTRDMLFADDAATVATHTQEELQSLMDCFSQACKDFGLTISLKKTNVLGQDTEALSSITIDNYELDAVCQFTYLLVPRLHHH